MILDLDLKKAIKFCDANKVEIILHNDGFYRILIGFPYNNESKQYSNPLIGLFSEIEIYEQRKTDRVI